MQQSEYSLPDPVIFGEAVRVIIAHRERHNEQVRRRVTVAGVASSRRALVRRRVRAALAAEVEALEAFIADPTTGAGAADAARCRLAVQRARLARL